MTMRRVDKKRMETPNKRKHRLEARKSRRSLMQPLPRKLTKREQEAVARQAEAEKWAYDRGYRAGREDAAKKQEEDKGAQRLQARIGLASTLGQLVATTANAVRVFIEEEGLRG